MINHNYPTFKGGELARLCFHCLNPKQRPQHKSKTITQIAIPHFSNTKPVYNINHDPINPIVQIFPDQQECGENGKRG
jgi:hypothetical protein